jgi:hypothetical protein
MKRFLVLALLAISLVSSLRSAELSSYGGGVLFPGSSGVQTYYAQVTSGKNPLLKIYIFLAGEHFYTLLRQTQEGSGSMEYQSYANGGATRKGQGTFQMNGTSLRITGGKGFRLSLELKGSRLLVQYTGLSGKYRSSGTLRHFQPTIR